MVNAYLTIDIGNAIVSLLASGIFAYAIYKRRDLIQWFPAYFMIAIGQVFQVFSSEKGDNFNTISLMFSVIGVILILVAVYFEYRALNKGKKKINRLFIFSTAPMSAFSTIGISVVMLILIIMGLIVILRIYSKTRSPIHLFISILLILGSISLIVALIDIIPEVDTIQAEKFLGAIQQALILSSGIVALIELRIIESRDAILNSRKALENAIKASSELSENVSTMTTDLATNANEINASIEEISSTSTNIAQNSQNQATNLAKMNEMTSDLKKIASFITNISEQTNLLALNASIEAGRAGEHGRGFAVVAEKVQKLAEESKNSVEKSIGIIEIISNNIGKASEDSKSISISMEEINSAIEEQTASIEEMTAQVNRIGGMALESKEKLVKKKFK